MLSKQPPRSLNLAVKLTTLTSLATVSVSALLDSGATGNFVSPKFVRKHGLEMTPLPQPIPVCNIDGTPNKNGAITEELSGNAPTCPAQPLLHFPTSPSFPFSFLLSFFLSLSYMDHLSHCSMYQWHACPFPLLYLTIPISPPPPLHSLCTHSGPSWDLLQRHPESHGCVQR
ncbi:uncharacterized protein EI90DRAFT_2919858 [Cantharellus anzutake]|uniref:uncharacterized protein n=1 Tax=Cantharellus anzutake TaxID=1750568 RepID=UPI0019054CE5|nr:uncharacterized protein EI90DRAFT_2919858 [Cantharellus anzutake]KAF8331729.1 hypothetical protein EI90DRAFT_2919858 [Cantharellus anzutake]